MTERVGIKLLFYLYHIPMPLLQQEHPGKLHYGRSQKDLQVNHNLDQTLQYDKLYQGGGMLVHWLTLRLLYLPLRLIRKVLTRWLHPSRKLNQPCLISSKAAEVSSQLVSIPRIIIIKYYNESLIKQKQKIPITRDFL